MPCAACSTSIDRVERDNHKILFSLVVLEEWLRSNQPATARAAA